MMSMSTFPSTSAFNNSNDHQQHQQQCLCSCNAVADEQLQREVQFLRTFMVATLLVLGVCIIAILARVRRPEQQWGIEWIWRKMSAWSRKKSSKKLLNAAENSEKIKKKTDEEDEAAEEDDDKKQTKTEKSKKKRKQNVAKAGETSKLTPETHREIVQMQAELWTDIVDWLPALALAQGLSLANRQLHQICAPKMYEQHPHVVNALGIERRDKDDKGDKDEYTDSEEESDEEEEKVEERTKKEEKKNKAKEASSNNGLKVRKYLWDSDYSELVEIPLATTGPPPPNILGFRKIRIYSVLDDPVLAFLRLILPIFPSNSVPMCIDYRRETESKMKFQQIVELNRLLQGKIASLVLYDCTFQDPYWKHMRPFLFSVQFLTFTNGRWYGDHEIPSLCRWLQNARVDALPRYFFASWHSPNCHTLVQRLRELFADAREPCSYICEFDVSGLEGDEEQPPPEPFSLRNGLNERLVLGRHGRAGRGDQMLVLRRFPAMAATVADDWMQPHLDKARRLFASHVTKFAHALDQRLEEDGLETDQEEPPLNELHVTLERSYANFD